MMKGKDSNNNSWKEVSTTKSLYGKIYIYILVIFSSNLDYLNLIENVKLCFYTKGDYFLLNGENLYFVCKYYFLCNYIYNDLQITQSFHIYYSILFSQWSFSLNHDESNRLNFITKEHKLCFIKVMLFICIISLKFINVHWFLNYILNLLSK